MKIILCFALFLMGQCFAEDVKLEKLTLTTGKEYEKVTVRKVTPSGISIMLAGGMATIPYEKLSKETQEQFGGFEDKKSKEYRGKVSMAQRKAQIAENKRVKNSKRSRWS